MNDYLKFYQRDIKGLFFSLVIFFCWVFHLYYCLQLKSFEGTWLAHLWFQSFLSTGLFIMSHDAMHGLLLPHFPKVGDFIGKICLFAYAGLLFEKLKKKHFEHHEFTATDKDPDYAKNQNENFWMWIMNFMRNYYGIREYLIMHLHVLVIFSVGEGFLNLFFFFAFPSWISAIQLFYFGTYLPHKNFQHDHSEHSLRARSNDMPVFLSLLTCYHFGYHYEHHKYPMAAWWELPKLRWGHKEKGVNFLTDEHSI